MASNRHNGAVSNAAGKEIGPAELVGFFTFARRSDALRRWARESDTRMTDWSEEESEALLGKHSLGRTGMQVKLDKGFQPGDYCVYVEYRGLADRVGFTAARRQAVDYASRLHGHLAGMEGYAMGAIEDASHSGDPRRKRDLECSFTLL